MGLKAIVRKCWNSHKRSGNKTVLFTVRIVFFLLSLFFWSKSTKFSINSQAAWLKIQAVHQMNRISCSFGSPAVNLWNSIEIRTIFLIHYLYDELTNQDNLSTLNPIKLPKITNYRITAKKAIKTIFMKWDLKTK